MKQNRPTTSEALDQALDQYRDAIAAGLKPANPFEGMLVDVIAQNYQRRQKLIELMDYMFETVSPASLVSDSFEKLKAIQKMVAQADRAYRLALGDLYRAQKNRIADAKRTEADSAREPRPTPPSVNHSAPKPAVEPLEAMAAGRASPAN